MPVRSYPNRLIIARDTATGFCRVGWLTEMLEERFELVEVICETESSTPISPGSPHYSAYVDARERARQLNASLLAQQHQSCLARGWYPVPLETDDDGAHTDPDEFGGQLSVASNTLARLVRRDHTVWAIIAEGKIVHVAARHPAKDLAELEYQVWQADILDRLSRIAGDLVEGELLATETGLWFRRTDATRS